MQEPNFEGKTAEQVAEENERRIVRFTNIDGEDFTHSFRGISITVRAGESYVGRFPECDHLATHLARKMLARARKASMSNQEKESGKHLFTKEEVEALKEKILTPQGVESPKTLTPEEKRRLDLEMISKGLGREESGEPVKVTKADVIRDLKAKGVKPDENKSRDELLKELIELESRPT